MTIQYSCRGYSGSLINLIENETNAETNSLTKKFGSWAYRLRAPANLKPSIRRNARRNSSLKMV